jgi:hypothetical protein
VTTRFSRSETVLPYASIEAYERTATRLVQASTQWSSSFARSAENRTLILGIIWACWHLPLSWITVWGTLPTILNMVLYIPSVIFMTIVFTWIFDNTEGSMRDRCGAIGGHRCERPGLLRACRILSNSSPTVKRSVSTPERVADTYTCLFAGLNNHQRQQLSAVPVALCDGLASEYDDACPSLR